MEDVNRIYSLVRILIRYLDLSTEFFSSQQED